MRLSEALGVSGSLQLFLNCFSARFTNNQKSSDQIQSYVDYSEEKYSLFQKELVRAWSSKHLIIHCIIEFKGDELLTVLQYSLLDFGFKLRGSIRFLIQRFDFYLIEPKLKESTLIYY